MKPKPKKMDLANLLKQDAEFIKSVTAQIIESVLQNEDFKQKIFQALNFSSSFVGI